MTKHTPGPWTVGGELVSKAGTSIEIASVWDNGHPQRRDAPSFDEAEANRQLIALAPEVYEVLVALFEHCAMIHNVWGDGCNQKQSDEAQRRGKAILKKVRGE